MRPSAAITAVTMCIGLLLHAEPVIAQHVSDLTPGTRIRISAPSYFAQPDVGELKTVARDTLIYLDALYAERLVPLGDVRRLELSEGVKSAAGSGALLGFAIGAGTSAVVMYAWCDGTDDCPVSTMSLAAAGVGGALGAAVGAIVRSPRKERWRTVSLKRGD